MKDHVSVKEWLQQDDDTRRRLIMQFAIAKSSPTQTLNNELVCDGVTEKDLGSLSIGKMVAYLKEDLAWYQEDLCEVLFKMCIDKMYGRPVGEGVGGRFFDDAGIGKLPDGLVVDNGTTHVTVAEAPVPRRAGRPRKQAPSVPEAP